MSISNLYNIGMTGVRAQRLALDVTGENIANVNTEGYSRQQVIFTEDNVTTNGGFQLGTGVKVTAIQRSYDALLQLQLVNGGSAEQRAVVEQSALQRVEPLFNELGADGLGKAIADYFGAWQDLSTNPTGSAERQAVYTRGQILTDTFHQVDSGLTATKTIANDSLAEITASITDMASNIARLNGMITTSEQLGSGTGANELRDQRDLLVRQISEKAGISYRENSDGTVDVQLAGNELVVGDKYAKVYNSPPNSATLSSIYMTTVGTPPVSKGVATDMTIYSPTSTSNQLSYLGELGGTLNVRDHIIPDIKAKVDLIASSLANQVNTTHNLGSYFDATGAAQPGGIFFADATPITATNIALDPALTAGKIAAATGPGTLVPGNNANALNIAALLTTPLPSQTYTLSGTVNSKVVTSTVALPGLFKGMLVAGGGFPDGTTIVSIDNSASPNVSLTLSNALPPASPPTVLTFSFPAPGSKYTALVSEIGVAVQSANNVAANHQSFMRQITNLREANSGVSLDEELTNLIKYQRAFEGSAKLINTATEMLDIILGMVR